MPPSRVRCSQTTLEGRVCSRKATQGHLCTQHQKMKSDSISMQSLSSQLSLQPSSCLSQLRRLFEGHPFAISFCSERNGYFAEETSDADSSSFRYWSSDERK